MKWWRIRSADAECRRWRISRRDRMSGPAITGLVVAGVVMAGLLALQSASASDWPTYRGDIARSGVTEDRIQLPLAPRWVYQPRHRPSPAWGEPNPRPVGGWHGLTEQRRVHFDDAFHVITSGDGVFFGSSADGSVVCLDADTGRQRWRFLTGGPVRLAPTAWQDRVYVGSDDGHVYCLNREDGSLLWKFRGAPGERKVLGSGKMISLWPVRTGVLIDEGIAYFGAGIFPAEGVYLYAVRADDGQLLWCNDSCAAAPQSRISPQGYLLASQSRLFVPLGRVSPAAFDRADGHLLYESYTEHIIGGTNASLSGDQLFTGTEQIIGYDQASHRSQSAWFWGHRLVVTPEMFFAATGRELFAVRRDTYGAASLRRKRLLDSKRDLGTQLQRARSGPQAEVQRLEEAMKTLNGQIAEAEAEMDAGQSWRVPCTGDDALIQAGDVLVVGGNQVVEAFDSTSGERLWSESIDGRARGLAVADGQLFVSSDSGTVYCFGRESAERHGVRKQRIDPAPFPDDEMAAVYEQAAERIVETTGIRRGYCLVLGCGTGRLAMELAKRTELKICGVEPDADRVREARRALDAAGFYGDRVLVEQAELSQVPFADYFANLIVSETAMATGEIPASADEAFRMLKPMGGTVCIGQPTIATGTVPALTRDTIRSWTADSEFDEGQISEEGGMWLEFQRGPLPGAGSWTHQYANAGNTACSDDQRVRCPLGVLWFGEPGPGPMAERHRRAAAPLATGGRMFVLGEGEANRIGVGENKIMAYDAYNGLKLWERRIRGALRVSVTHDAGNSAVNADSLFVAVGDECLRFDAETGDTVFTYKMPPAKDEAPRSWGYIAVVGDVLYGSRSARGRTADCLFALDLDSGRVLWTHESKDIAQGSISIGEGRCFFAAPGVTEQERREALAPQIKELHRMDQAKRDAVLKQMETAAVFRVVSLDAATGQVRWERPVEVTGASGGSYWCSLGSVYHQDTLVLFGVFLDGHYWTQFFAGQFETRKVLALSGTDGQTLWEKQIGYRVRPVVVGDTLHAEPWAYDLRTGEQRTRVNPVTGEESVWQFARPGHHCGCPAASPHTLLFRSYNLGWYDLERDDGTQHFGAQRPGCWINFIPANGLLMVPEASSGCMCPFPNICTVVFKSREENRQWSYYSQPGPMTPVTHLALNPGAPGDRKDEAGTLWLGYPRPKGSLVLQWDSETTFYPGWSYFNHDPARREIEGTDSPWVFRCGVSGLRRWSLPLADAVDGRARYTVRLAFAELEHQAAGQRVFDIRLQGQVVAADFDIFQAAGGRNRAVIKTFSGIEADGELVLEFATESSQPTETQLPILQGIEIQREEVLSLGVAVPDFLLSDGQPEQTAEMVIVNRKDADFEGLLRVQPPEGFAVTPAETPLRIPSGDRMTVRLTAAVRKQAAAGKTTLDIQMIRADGSREYQQEAALEYLGNRRRVTVQAIEDTHAQRQSPTSNYGTSAALNVDGGDRQMGDHHHSVAFLKFQLPAEGRPASVILRLFNAGNPTGNSGQIRKVVESWSERRVTYEQRPELGNVVGKLGRVAENEILEIPLEVSLQDVRELSLAIDPTGCDGVNYISREAGKPAELVIEYVEEGGR